MVWSITDPKTKKPLFIHTKGNNARLDRKIEGACEEFPEGWKIVEIKGKLYPKRVV